jgi:hypothetical protein
MEEGVPILCAFERNRVLCTLGPWAERLCIDGLIVTMD